MDFGERSKKAESIIFRNILFQLVFKGIFAPAGAEGERIFYGTQHAYCLLRFYFTLYERFIKARELANDFENNVKTKLLSKDVRTKKIYRNNIIIIKDKEKLAEERYNNFKISLVHLIRLNVDNEKYEDLLRSMFGTKAYLMFFIDKIVHSVTLKIAFWLRSYQIIITTQKMASDDITVKTLNLFTESNLLVKHSDPNKMKNNAEKSKNWPELVFLAQLNHLTLYVLRRH